MPVERTSGGTSLIDVLDRVLDKGIVIDAWVRVSLVGIDLITVEARIVVASIDTYLKYSEAVGQVALGVQAGGPGAGARIRDRARRERRPARGSSRPAREAASACAGSSPPAGRRQAAVAPAPPLAGEDRPAWLGPRPWPPARRSRGAPPCRRKPAWAWPSSCSPATTSRSARSASLEWLAEYAGARCGRLPGRGRRAHAAVRDRDATARACRRSSRWTSRTAPIRWWRRAFGRQAVTFAERRGERRSVAARPRAHRGPAHVRAHRARERPRPALLVVSPPRANHGLAGLGGAACSPRRSSGWGAAARSRRRTAASARERTLLDAVPDPILLTDPEGRVLIANARAKALLVAEEGESEGRRRAVALNNMLFSVRARPDARSRRASRARELPLVDPVEGSDLPLRAASARRSRHPRGHGARLHPAQRHRPAPRQRGDRGELPQAAHRRGGRARRARPPRPHHRLRRRPHPRDRPRGRAGHDERARGAPLHGARDAPIARARRARAGQRRALLVVRRRTSSSPRGRAAARRDRPRRSGDGPPAARRGDLRQDPLRARRGHGDRHRSSTTAPRRSRSARLYEELKKASAPARGEGARGHRRARRPERAAARQRIELEQASAPSRSSWPTCRTSSARR